MIPNFAALLLGAAAAFGFAPFALWPLTLACLAGLFALLERAGTWRRAATLGWWFGLGNFVIGLNWIATAFTYQAAMPAWLGWIAVVVVSLYLAVFPMVAAGVAWRLARRGPALAFALASTWIVGELLRATLFTGFAWNPLGVIWIAPETAQSATLVGTYGLSGMTVLTGGALSLLARWRWKTAALTLAPGIVLTLVAALTAGAPLPGSAPLLRIVQPNINQAEKADPAMEQRNYARLASLSGRPGPSPRLLLWPEAAVPSFLEEEGLARADLAALLGPRDLLLTGGTRIERDRDGEAIGARNSLFVLDPAARLRGRYDKAHLVPYGEYLPMRPILSAIGLSRLVPGDLDFWPGPGPRDVELPGIGPVGVQICYEIVFSGQVVDRAHRPRFLFNPSNDAWFGRWGPPQHLAQARLRAIEEGLPVVRATPTGISAVVDADGHLLAALPWRQAGAIEQALPLARAATPFARFGNALPLLLAAVLLIAGFATRRRSS